MKRFYISWRDQWPSLTSHHQMEATLFLLKETQNFTQKSHILYISVGVGLRAFSLVRLHWVSKIVGVDLPAIEELYNTLFAPLPSGRHFTSNTAPPQALQKGFLFLVQCADWRTPVFPCDMQMHFVYFISCPFLYHCQCPDGWTYSRLILLFSFCVLYSTVWIVMFLCISELLHPFSSAAMAANK